MSEVTLEHTFGELDFLHAEVRLYVLGDPQHVGDKGRVVRPSVGHDVVVDLAERLLELVYHGDTNRAQFIGRVQNGVGLLFLIIHWLILILILIRRPSALIHGANWGFDLLGLPFQLSQVSRKQVPAKRTTEPSGIWVLPGRHFRLLIPMEMNQSLPFTSSSVL